MKKIVKQNVGLDLSKKDFKACISVKFIEKGKERIKIEGTGKFTNDLKGFTKFMNWVIKKNKGAINFENTYFTLEATGVYYENLAYFLYDHGYYVSVLLPNKSNAYAKSLNIKTKTDKVDAKMLAQMGLERSLELWQPLSSAMCTIRKLCRERGQLIKVRTQEKCRLEAEKNSHESQDDIIERKKNHIQYLMFPSNLLYQC